MLLVSVASVTIPAAPLVTVPLPAAFMLIWVGAPAGIYILSLHDALPILLTISQVLMSPGPTTTPEHALEFMSQPAGTSSEKQSSPLNTLTKRSGASVTITAAPLVTVPLPAALMLNSVGSPDGWVVF